MLSFSQLFKLSATSYFVVAVANATSCYGFMIGSQSTRLGCFNIPDHRLGITNRLLASSEPEQEHLRRNSFQSTMLNFLEKVRTASAEGFGTRARNVASTCQPGDIIVPLCGDLERRRYLAGRGIYAGVEYLIYNISNVETTGSNINRNDASVAKIRTATIRPAYPLRAHLERSDWPVTVSLSDVPLWLSKTTYEAGTALGTFMLAGTYLALASIIASIITFAVVPTESMMPALIPGDVVLVTRSLIIPPKVGDVIFFNPPSSLDDTISKAKIGDKQEDGDRIQRVVSTKGKKFIKRVVAVPGEKVGVFHSNPYVVLCDESANDSSCPFLYRIDKTGEYARPDIFPDESWNRETPSVNLDGGIERDQISPVLGDNEYFVAGDNGFRSVDSRVWGTLQRNNIFGTAQYIVFPPSRVGKIPYGPIVSSDELQ